MYQYDLINEMTTEKILDYLVKAESQLQYYRMIENGDAVIQLKSLIETCNFIIDERGFLDYTETYWPADGIVIDTSNNSTSTNAGKKNNDLPKPRRKRYN